MIEEKLKAAGFELLRANQPGLWARTELVGDKLVPVELDLLVGEQLAGTGRRSADIKPHDKMTARRVTGLEVAVVDRSPMTITALDDSGRSMEVNVAGPAALLVAKVHKIHDRLLSPDRLTNKDAGDVFRLMAGVPQQEVLDAFRVLVQDPLVGEVTRRGIELLHDQFGGAATPGVQLAVEALAGDIPADRIRLAAPAYAKAVRRIG